MGYQHFPGRAFRRTMLLSLAVALILLLHPDLRERVGRLAGAFSLDPRLEPAEIGGRGDAQVEDKFARAGPLRPSEDPGAIAIYPTLYPRGLGLDGYVWRVLYDRLALGSTLLLRRPCLDPARIEATMRVESQLPLSGRLPAAADLMRWSEGLGLRRLIVPVLTEVRNAKPSLSLRYVEVAGDGTPELEQELASVELTVGSPIVNSAAIDALADRALTALGGQPAVGSAPIRRFESLPPHPEDLLDRLQAAASAADRGEAGAPELAELGRSYSVLGYHLTQGMSGMGPLLLVRGAALCDLASSSASNSRDGRLIRAFSRLLARHTAHAVEILKPLEAAGDPDARALIAACMAKSDELKSSSRNVFLYRVALERRGEDAQVGPEVEALTRRGLPLDFALSSSAWSFGVGLARQWTTHWLKESFIRQARRSGARSGSLAFRMRADSPAALIEESGRALDRERASYSRPTHYEAVRVSLDQHGEQTARSEIRAMPGVQYMLLAYLSWSVEEQGRQMEAALRRHLPLASCSWAGLALRASRNGERTEWGEEWLARERHNPFAQVYVLAQRFEESSIANRVGALDSAWELANVSRHLVLQFARGVRSMHRSQEPLVEGLKQELDIDPWDGKLWKEYLAVRGEASPRIAVQSELSRAQAVIPDSIPLRQAEATLQLDRRSPVAAAGIYQEIAQRFPGNHSGMSELMRTYLHAVQIAKAEKLLPQIRERMPSDQSLTVAHYYGRVGELLISFSKLDRAREYAEIARAIDEWKHDVFLFLGRLAIHEGRIDEGKSWYARSESRYSSQMGNYCLVRDLCQTGRPEAALEFARSVEGRAAPGTPLLRDLGRGFIAGGQAEHGLSYLRKQAALDDGQLITRDRLMLEDASVAVDAYWSRDTAAMGRLVDLTAQRRDWEVLDRLRMNPYPEAIQVMMERIRDPLLGDWCRSRLACIAWIDLDIHKQPTGHELDRACEKLEEWWRLTRPRYIESRFE